MNKASGSDGIPVEVFQIRKDDAVKVLHSICQQIWNTQQWPQDWKRSVFIPTPKKGNTKKCSNYCTIALVSHTSKVMLNVLRARLQQYVNRELLVFKLDLEKAEKPEIRLPTSAGLLKKEESSRSIYFCFIDYSKAFDCVDHNYGKFFKISEYQPPDLPPDKCVFRSRSNSENWTWKNQESSRKTSTSASLTMLNPFDCVDHNKMWKILQRWEYQTTLPAS